MKIKLFLLSAMLLSILVAPAYSFTAVRPDLEGYKPETPMQKRAEQQKSPASERSFDSDSNFNESSSSSQPSSYGQGSSPSEASAPEVSNSSTPEPQQTSNTEKYSTAPNKTSIVLTYVFAGLVVLGLVVWYFTRNINFKRLFNK